MRAENRRSVGAWGLGGDAQLGKQKTPDIGRFVHQFASRFALAVARGGLYAGFYRLQFAPETTADAPGDSLSNQTGNHDPSNSNTT